jgi:hypothetical protein
VTEVDSGSSASSSSSNGTSGSSATTRWRRLLWTLLSAALLLVLLAPAGCSRLGRDGDGAEPLPLAAGGPAGRLQEVAPPVAVQQLRQALDGHQPRLRITAPADESVLPAGDWTLRIDGSDWPLADAGELGLGAHLTVQVDDGPPLRVTGEPAGPGGAARETFELAVPMAELTPGSHRISVFAARPWGEVVKSPGASAQIRVHRVAANPLSLPARGTPQLLAVSPAELSGAEPQLVDWWLQDAPLQGLRDGDARWRLRVTINGDSFLVDQNAPLWLRGWRQGSNSLQLELVDERGEPINPPFNSLVREVTLTAAGPRPRWLGGALSDRELATLLGEIPAAPPEDPAAAQAPAAEPPMEPEATPEPEPEAQAQAELEVEVEVDPVASDGDASAAAASAVAAAELEPEESVSGTEPGATEE